MKVSVREARKDFSKLLKLVEAGEDVTITRNNREIARLVPKETIRKTLPDLAEFRNTIKLKGEAMSETIVKMREEQRY